MSTEPSAVSDEKAIRGVIQHYIEGATTGKSAEMKRAFHEDATIFGYAGPDLMRGPVQQLYDWNDGNGPAKDIKVGITNIDIAETVATVRLDIENWTGHRFTDFFTLLKVDGQWKIINKVFHLHG